MKLARLGLYGHELPAVVTSETEAVFVDHLVHDWGRAELESGALEKVQQCDLSALPKVKLSDYRVGAPLARPTKIICVGLNYAQHALETGASAPIEPIVFMKAPDTLIGPFDDIVIPPSSEKTDYEVELAVVIGSSALYLKSPADARQHILGYSISQDVSERYWQLERTGQWVKGKSFPTFNPMGPVIVTADSFDPDDVRLWCTVDGEMRQDSRTSDLIFGVDFVVWYISQFMQLNAGDVINTGTPQGVGMGWKPTRYLKPGEEVTTGIDGIGVIKSRTRNFKG
jgi:2-keto-4-pentenoate hydratase/2-oxohepta-3-ene-1,7-dioic acid hydratase in catechol pathway